MNRTLHHHGTTCLFQAGTVFFFFFNTGKTAWEIKTQPPLRQVCHCLKCGSVKRDYFSHEMLSLVFSQSIDHIHKVRYQKETCIFGEVDDSHFRIERKLECVWLNPKVPLMLP